MTVNRVSYSLQLTPLALSILNHSWITFTTFSSGEGTHFKHIWAEEFLRKCDCLFDREEWGKLNVFSVSCKYQCATHGKHIIYSFILIFPQNMWGSYSHLADEKTETQEGLLTFLRPQKAEPEYKPRFFDIQKWHYHFRVPRDCTVECGICFLILRTDLHQAIHTLVFKDEGLGKDTFS